LPLCDRKVPDSPGGTFKQVALGLAEPVPGGSQHCRWEHAGSTRDQVSEPDRVFQHCSITSRVNVAEYCARIPECALVEQAP